jgi:sugar-specific transcriptional regulator TrmB
MNPEIALKEAGLPNNDVKVYLALLDLGSALAGEITKKSGVNRTNVYDSLDKLIERGLVSYVIQANRKYFEATTPESLIKYLDEKESNIKKQKKLINNILPELESRRALSQETYEATIYKGKKGLKSIAEDVLKTKSTLLAFGAEGRFVETFRHYAAQWHMRRNKLKIPVKIIYNEKIRKNKLKARFPILQMKFNSHMDDTPATTWIYGDKVAIVIWQGKEPIATLIRSNPIAKSYKQFFNILWQNSKQ